ncbi:MAG: sodium/solute symporter [Opitutales bacterium]
MKGSLAKAWTAGLLVLAFAGTAGASAETVRPFLSWEALPDPPSPGVLEGAFAGQHHGALLVAGGESTGAGGISDQVFVLARDGTGEASWRAGFSLSRPVARAGSVAPPHGLLVAGGTGLDGDTGEVFLLRWDPVNGTVSEEELPPLPVPSVSPAVAFFGGEVFVIGSGNALYLLDLEKAVGGVETAGWREGPRLPGLARRGAVTAVLSDGEGYRLFVMGGKMEAGEPLLDGYRLGPLGGVRSWEPVSPAPRALVGTGASWGRAHLLALGAPDGEGMGQNLLSYHSITDAWADRGPLPFTSSPVVVTRWEEGLTAIVADSGGQGKMVAYRGTADRVEPWFSRLDYAVLGFYLVGLVALGSWCSRRNKGTADYFLAGRRIPAWAAALSLMATSVSSIGFIAIPAKSFATDWLYFAGIATWFVAVPIVTLCFIPVLRRLNVTTAYEYLETRFNLSVRLFAALLFVFMQIGRLAIVLYLPALVLSSVVGMDIYLCIAVMGVVTIAYTVLGGMEAVVWTDVVQVIVLFGGAVVAIVIALTGTGMEAGELWETAWSDGKLRVADWRWDHTAAVFWVVIVGNIFTRFSNLTSDQAIVQRYLSTPDTRSAVRSLWGDVAVSIPWAFIAFAFGTALYLFYKTNPGLLLPGTEADSVVPVFIGMQMPPGLAGLIVASIFAAAMSSLDSTIHSLSTVCVRDFYGRLRPTSTEAGQFTAARGLTIFFGMAGTVAAIVIATYDVKSLWDLFILIMGLFVGSLSGLFIMGLFCKRCHGRGALVGAMASAAIVYAVSAHTAIHFFLFPVVGVLACVGIGYVASLVIPSGRREKLRRIEKELAPAADASVYSRTQ